MISLVLPALADAQRGYVTRLRTCAQGAPEDALLVSEDTEGATFSGRDGLLDVDGATADELDGDVVLVDPAKGRVERLLRARSPHNTLLITERCDQLCVMCSQPPKKTHVDRFEHFEKACLLAPEDMLIGVSGGEPTLYKDQLLGLIERVGAARPDLTFHVLSNGQHFDEADVERLSAPVLRTVSWGVPIYADVPDLHDRIVGKEGAFALLERGLAALAMAGARVELRTVVLRDNVEALPTLARHVIARLSFVEAWSIMQLEHVGFAKGRWASLFVDHGRDFRPIGEALDVAILHGVRAQMFNFPRCTVPAAYRHLAIASISDWKRKFAPACAECRERDACSGFFEWHPDEEASAMADPL